MSTLFIADLHLYDARPAITELFERYLASDEARAASAVYILGDLVEAWIGDDDDAELPARIAHATRALRDSGYTGYLSSEYEGDRIPWRSIEQIRRQHSLLRATVAEL